MANVKLNFSEAGDNPGEGKTLIPEGLYEAYCVGCELKGTKADPAKKMFEFTFKLPAFGGEERKLYNMIGATDKNTYLKSTLVALGHQVPKGDFTFDPDLLKGKKCKVKIKHETRQGTGEYAGRTFTDDKIALAYGADYTGGDGASSGGALDLTGGSSTSAPLTTDIPF